MEAPKTQIVREQVGMRRWLRLTARKSAQVPQKSENAAATAAADALAAMLKDSGKTS